MTADEFQRMLMTITGAPAPGTVPKDEPQNFFEQGEATRLATQQTAQALEQTNQKLTQLSDFMNPYLNLTEAELQQEFRNLGLTAYESLAKTDRLMAVKKLNMLKEMDDYTDQILAYNQGKSISADQGFERKAFDVFVKTNKTNPKGVPLDQNYKYIPKSIPEAHVKFDGKMFNLKQGDAKISAKKFQDIEKVALKGGDYSDELKAFREIKQAVDKKEMPMNVIFKSRKI